MENKLKGFKIVDEDTKRRRDAFEKLNEMVGNRIALKMVTLMENKLKERV